MFEYYVEINLILLQAVTFLRKKILLKFNALIIRNVCHLKHKNID